MRRPDAGFTMVEVLVAVLLLAVGLVGALAMQAHAMRARQESALLTDALQAAATLAERIRANAAHSSAYLGFDFDAAAAPDAPTPDACPAAGCDAAGSVQRDLHDFRRQLQSVLPGGRATVCRDAATPDGQLQWPCSGDAGASLVIKIGWRSRHPNGSARADTPSIVLPVALAPAAPAPPAPLPPPSPSPGGPP